MAESHATRQRSRRALDKCTGWLRALDGCCSTLDTVLGWSARRLGWLVNSAQKHITALFTALHTPHSPLHAAASCLQLVLAALSTAAPTTGPDLRAHAVPDKAC